MTNASRNLRPTPSRGSSLVVAATFVIALTIMVVGSLNAFTSTSIAYDSFDARADLVYAAIGFVHAVKADLAAGNDSTFAPYRFTTSLSEVGSGYPVEASYGGGDIVSTIYCYYQLTGDFMTTQTITVYAQREYNSRTLTVKVSVEVEYTTYHTVFNYGAFGANGVSINNGDVDSYDGSLGVYDPLLPNSNGDIGSNGDISLSTWATVNGDATVASGGSITNGGTITGEQVLDAPPAEFPAVDMPAFYSPPGPDANWSGTIDITSGEHHFGDITTARGAIINITGPATIIFDSADFVRDVQLNIDNSAGQVDVIVVGSFDLNASASVNTTTNLPKDFTLILLGDNVDGGDSITLNAGSGVVGRIYAPNAHVQLSSGAGITGQIVAEEVTLNSGAYIHFDETLRTDLFANVDDPTDTPAEFISESWAVENDPDLP